jgi:Fe-S-cluster containining protein
MDDLESDLRRARELDVDELAAAIRSIGFECTRCGACCRGNGEDEEHTATVFPDEVRAIVAGSEAAGDGAGREATGAGGATGDAPYDWRDVARPMPFGLERGPDGALTGETFEWALQTDACGDCTFYDDGPADGPGACTIYADRPMICETYPFSVDLGGSEPMGEVVEAAGPVRAHECEGLGREIDEADARDLARTLKERAIREVEEMIAVRDAYEPADPGPEEVVVHDSEGAKNSDGSPYR